MQSEVVVFERGIIIQQLIGDPTLTGKECRFQPLRPFRTGHGGTFNCKHELRPAGVSGFTRDYMEAIGMPERLIGRNKFMRPRKSRAVATGNRLFEASGILAEVIE